MKKISLFILLILLAINGTSQTEKFATTIVETYLKDSATHSGNDIIKVPKNTKLKILSEKETNYYLFVEYKDIKGYVYSMLVKKSPGNNPQKQKTTSTSKTTTYSKCPPGQHWVKGHYRTRNGKRYWVRGHCRKN